MNEGPCPDDRNVELDEKQTDRKNSGPGDAEDDRASVEKKTKATSDEHAGGQEMSPLDFLLGVLRDQDTTPHLRFKVASIIAPYIHPKRKTASAERDALSDFNIDFPTAKTLRDDQDRYKRLYPYHNSPEALELKARIAATKNRLMYPAGYGTTEVTKDSRRLGELSDKRRSAKLTQKEDAEQAILNARVAAFKGTPEAEKWARDCFRIWQLTYKRQFRPDALTEEEKTELDSLRALYPGLSHEPDNYDQRMMLSFSEKMFGDSGKGRTSDHTARYYRPPKTG